MFNYNPINQDLPYPSETMIRIINHKLYSENFNITIDDHYVIFNDINFKASYNQLYHNYDDVIDFVKEQIEIEKI